MSGTSLGRLLTTDQKGSVLGHYSNAAGLGMAYTPYGYRAERSGLPTHLGFNGQRRDSSTGYYHLGAGRRAFSPVLMRFNRPDELSPFGEGGLNCYAYCVGDPINAVDPSGQFPSFPMPLARFFSKRRVAAAPEAYVAKSTRYHLAQDVVQTQQAFPGLTDLRSHGGAAISFSDQGNFYLSAHGDPSGNIYFGLLPRSPGRAYHKLVKDGVDFSRHDSVNLMICYSAGGRGERPVKKFAELTGLPVTGNVGVGWDTGKAVAKYIRSGVLDAAAEQYARKHYYVITSYQNRAPANKRLREMARYKHHTKVFRQ